MNSTQDRLPCPGEALAPMRSVVIEATISVRKYVPDQLAHHVLDELDIPMRSRVSRLAELIAVELDLLASRRD